MILLLWIFVQILMESLPVSSSGHVAILKKIAGVLWTVSASCEWVIDFILHGPTIVILLLFFFKKWWQLIFNEPISLKVVFSKNGIVALFRALLFVFMVDGITFLFWLGKNYVQLPLYVGFLITAFSLYSLRYVSLNHKKFIWKLSDAFILGLIQAGSLIPGVSRFATTYTASRFLGYKAQDSLAISFGIQFPLIVAAFIKGCVAVRACPNLLQELFDLPVLFAMLCATFISYFLLWLVLRLAEKNSLWKISWYMIVPIVISFVL